MAVKLLIDSSSDISREDAKKLGINLVSMEVRFGEDIYLDGVDLSTKEFYEKLEKCTELPKTSQINPYRFEEVFEKLTKDGDEVVAIVISSKLSGTYQSAVEASKKFNGKVFVVDSMSAASGERILGYYALELIMAGFSAKDIKEKLDEIKSRVCIKAVVNTLKYLKMGGRVSATVAFAGELFSIKPLVGLVEGEVKMIGKAMGAKKANEQLVSLIQKTNGIDLDKPYCLIYSGNEDTAVKKFASENGSLWGNGEILSYQIGSTIGTHVGPGAVGIVYFEK